MVVDVAPVLSQLGKFSSTLLTLSLQVLFDSALLPMCGLLHVSPEQGLLVELFPAHVTPKDTNKQHISPELESCPLFCVNSGDTWTVSLDSPSIGLL